MTNSKAATHAANAPNGQCGKCCDEVEMGSMSPASIGRLTGYNEEGDKVVVEMIEFGNAKGGTVVTMDGGVSFGGVTGCEVSRWPLGTVAIRGASLLRWKPASIFILLLVPQSHKT